MPDDSTPPIPADAQAIPGMPELNAWIEDQVAARKDLAEQVTELTAKIATLQQTVDDLPTAEPPDITEIRDAIAALAQRISGLEGAAPPDVTELRDAVATLDQRMERVEADRQKGQVFVGLSSDAHQALAAMDAAGAAGVAQIEEILRRDSSA